MKPIFHAGTVAMSVWSSDDLGETWFRPNSEYGMTNEARIWSVASHPDRPDRVLAGTDDGIFAWSDEARRWTRLGDALAGLRVWSVAVSPADPDLILAGLSPGRLLRSEDGGATWADVETRIRELCAFDVISRVTQIKFDPIDADIVWASVEIDAVWRSTDAGRTWTRFDNGLLSDDVHGVEILEREGRRRIVATTNKAVHVSDDDGATFRDVAIETPRAYFRAVAADRSRPGVLYVSNGDGPPGSWGRIYRSEDHGDTWAAVPLAPGPNSTIWTISLDAGVPDVVICCSNLGHIYVSEDAGGSFRKLERELGEVRSAHLRSVPG